MARISPLPIIAVLAYTLATAALAPLGGPQATRPPVAMPEPVAPTPEPAPAATRPRPTATPRATPTLALRWPPVPLTRSVFDFAEVYRDKCTVLLEQVPALAQERNLSCEAAAMRMVLAGRGLVVREEEILACMILDPNPHKGYRGNVDGPLHEPDMADYGAYAEEVARVLESFGAPARVVYGMSDDQLRAAIEHGRAVIVWMTRQPEPRIIDAGDYRLVDGQHVQVVVGLSTDGRFVAHDPWGARPDSGREGTEIMLAIRHWALFDRQAVVVQLQD